MTIKIKSDITSCSSFSHHCVPSEQMVMGLERSDSQRRSIDITTPFSQI